MPRLDPADAEDLVDILACWFEGHNTDELDEIVRKVRTRLALQASNGLPAFFPYGDCSQFPHQGAD